MKREEPQPKRRRGVVHEEDYQRNIIRNARVKGVAYTNYKNKQVPCKTKPQGISCKCNFKCLLSINQQVIDETWNYFYSLENKDIQDTYIQTLIEVKKIQRRRKKIIGRGDDDAFNNSVSALSFKRNHTYMYNLNVRGTLKYVCKNVFMTIHGISSDRISRICHLLLQNETPTDKRGTGRSGNAKSGETCARIHEHISKFEVKDTHYDEKPKKYLDASFTIKKMYDLFITDNQDLKDDVKYSFFHNYCKKNFEYSFGWPQIV